MADELNPTVLPVMHMKARPVRRSLVVRMLGGLFLGFALGAILAKVFHISSFEGGAGYFAVAIALLVTVLVAPLAIVVLPV